VRPRVIPSGTRVAPVRSAGALVVVARVAGALVVPARVAGALVVLAGVAGALVAPAAPAFAHGGDTPSATAYRTAVTGVTLDGVSVRAVEAGARLELANTTGHSVEILGYAGEPYLDVRPDGTWQNVNSPAAYINETLGGETAVPASADPTAPPAWRKISSATTVRWHDQRTHWLTPGTPAVAVSDPSSSHRLRSWEVPLRVQTEPYSIRGTLDWMPPPRAWLWWAGAFLVFLAILLTFFRFSPLLVGLSPLAYALTRAVDGGSVPIVVILAGLLALAAAYRNPPFYLVLSGAAVALFGGFAEAGVLDAAVVPHAGPAWLARSFVIIAIGGGAAMALKGVLRLRAALPTAPATAQPARLSSVI
jgi:hypothetical protein